MTRRSLVAFAALALVAAPGCATDELHLAALSTKPVPSLGYPSEGEHRVRDVSATVRWQMFLWIPTNTRTPTLQDAVDGALERGHGDLVVDADVTHWWVFVPFLYAQEGWTVHGDVLRSPETGESADRGEPQQSH